MDKWQLMKQHPDAVRMAQRYTMDTKLHWPYRPETYIPQKTIAQSSTNMIYYINSTPDHRENVCL